MEYLVILLSLLTCVVAMDDPIVYQIQEDQPARTRIGDLKADADYEAGTPLDQLHFVFLSQVPNSYISVDERSGVLETRQVLDRDEICPEQEECEIHIDIGIQPAAHFRIIKVILVIVDLNDHAPSFDPDVSEYSLSEATPTGELFMIVPARDLDSPENGIAYYNLVAPVTGQFELGVQNRPDGSLDRMSLNLLTELDYERQDLYILKVIAVDGGAPARSGTLTIRINVLDINDNNPVFDSEGYEVSIDENAIANEPLITVHARDPDAGSDGSVEYSFAPRTQNMHGSLFGIDAVSGAITLKSPLDYELHDSYSLTVVAQDQGVDSLPVSTRVIIKVNDLNDNEPQIIIDDSLLDDDGAFTVEEHSEVDSFVAHFSVEDKDDGPNGNVECNLQSEQFQLVKMYDYEYKLVTKVVLDRESTEEYSLDLECHDLGDPQHSTSETLKVKVTDINDHAPVFVKDVYESTLSENNMVDAFIDRVSASDADDGVNGKVRYELYADAGRAFRIDPKSGMIRSAVSFDREQNEILKFHVLAIDNGTPERTSTAMVILHIEDRDDQAPIFSERKYSFNISENTPIRTEIGAVNATDHDLPPNNGFNFYLDADPTVQDLFLIDAQTGMIYNKRQLDREVQSVYRLSVIVQSTDYAPMSDNCLVEVQVLDQNDNAPVITFPDKHNNTIYVSAQVPEDHIVAIVQAQDPDYAENGSLVFSLSEGNEKGEFMIRPQTGEILMKTAVQVLLQTDDKSKMFPLVIKVSDQGQKPRIAIETLKIVVDRTIIIQSSAQNDNPLSGLQDSQLAIIIAACCGIILVLGVILVVVFIRNRRRRASAHRRSSSKESWDSKELTTTTTMSPSCDQIRPHTEDTAAPRPQRPASTASSDLNFQYTNTQDTLNKPGDSDSGCADISHSDSQSSGEENKASGPPSPPLPPPPPEACNNFSDWVHNESFQLRRSGNSYRVSNNNMQRKTVRFDDEATTPPPPPPPAAFSNDYVADPVEQSTASPVIVSHGNSTHPMVVYPKPSNQKQSLPSPASSVQSAQSVQSYPHPHPPPHPRVHFANTLPRSNSSGANSPAPPTSGSRPSTPLGLPSSRSATPIVSILSDPNSSTLNPSNLNPTLHPSPQHRKGPYADISNTNKSSHFGSRGVIVPIATTATAPKTTISLQGWMNPNHCGDKDGSLV